MKKGLIVLLALGAIVGIYFLVGWLKTVGLFDFLVWVFVIIATLFFLLLLIALRGKRNY